MVIDRIVFDSPDVVRIQTHTSHVFLVGEDVYKIKKPVKFSFLDYSTLDARRTYCDREVALNRRFSPDLYRGVLPVTMVGDGTVRIGGTGEPMEWVVWMRRLPAESILTRRLAAGDVRTDEMKALAESLAAFYQTAETNAAISAFGSVAQVRENTEENFLTTLDFGAELLPERVRGLLKGANARFLEERAGLLEGRVRAGRIVDGHGDLKPENVFLPPSGPVVTDCIEFNERFRYGDVLADIAYLTMGLMDAGREDLRAAFLDRFAALAEPDYPAELLAYYEAYRAVVKGKIEGYRSLQPEVPDAERREATTISNRHFLLAARILEEAGLA